MESVNLLWAFLVAFCFERAEFMMTFANMGAMVNGFGAIDITNNRQAAAPMAYRVLVPWLVGFFEKIFHVPAEGRVDVYTFLRLLLVTLAFFGVAQAWGLAVMVVTAFLLLLTVKFDYWSWAAELAGISLAMTGDLTLAVLGTIVHGFSRETVFLVPLAYYCKTSDLGGTFVLGSLSAAIFFFIRLAVGGRRLYCDRFMFKANLSGLQKLLKQAPIFYGDSLLAVLISAAAVVSIASLPTGWPIPLALLGAGWVLAKADETRVFSAVLPWIAIFLVRR